MRRLYHRIYLTMIASLVLVVAITGGIWRFSAGGPPGMQVFEMAGELASGSLPAAGEPAGRPRTGDENGTSMGGASGSTRDFDEQEFR